MPSLDWTRFNSLPGEKTQNFENLCRALVRLRLGGVGQFAALKEQPGVEFHLKLLNSCPTLGDPPRWYGWQCKFHSRTQTKNLRAASKSDIEDSLRKTEKHLPELTDWVLWTPYTLSSKDQRWFDDLQTHFTLHQWTEKEIDTYLSFVPNLRGTYFGELIATPEELDKRHEEAVQLIRDRWLPSVHQSTDAERTIRRMLGESGSWDELTVVGTRLKEAADVISESLAHLESGMKQTVTPFVKTCSAFADTLLSFHNVLTDGDIDFIQQKLRERKTLIDKQAQSVPRTLRALNLSVTLDATNALDDMHVAQKRLDEVEEFLGVGLVALLAAAGDGKTQTAAQLTAAQDDRPAGVLLHGRNLHRGQTLDTLAGSLSLNADPLTSMEKLLAAIDAAGKRARCRLPIVIDGLNEAENPKDWKAPLSSLSETVTRYPNVLVVCTLRTGEVERRHQNYLKRAQLETDSRELFTVMALPEDVRRIESRGFGGDAEDAIGKYFRHYKIDPGDTEIPVELLQHPLYLRIFCEVMNPDHKAKVRVDHFPASLPLLFEKYVANACERISQFSNLNHSYTAEDVHRAVYMLGLEMWKVRRREIAEQDFRKITFDIGRSWDSSIVNLLMQEGIIFRNPGSKPYQFVITPSYDALGGFIVADSLLRKHIGDRELQWVREPDTIQAFAGESRHELAVDIFSSLVTLSPRRYGRQLWEVVSKSLRNAALRFAMSLDVKYLDQETVSAIRKLLHDNPKKESFLFSRLHEFHEATNHPLNGDFLDSVLRPMCIAERDLSWTEWIREQSPELVTYLIKIETRWKNDLADRTAPDRLRAKWMIWLLTSTNRKLRGVATRALYWFGRGDPEALFDDTIGSLEINDPYVPERMLAASYGVAMALHTDPGNRVFAGTTLLRYSRSLYDSLFAEDARFSTTHSLIRGYVTRTIELAEHYNPTAFSGDEIERSWPPFTDGGIRQWGKSKDSEERRSRSESPFRMDFENYTLGSLVPGRGNYDYENPEYRKVRAQILWRIEQLGWSSDGFGQIDSLIAKSYPSYGDHDPTKIDRYGKKYSWIAYFEMVGLRIDLGTIGRNDEDENGREWDVDIDPSFPIPVCKARIIDTDLLGAPEMRTEEWITNGALPDILPYLRVPEVTSEKGPWIMLDGFVAQEDKTRGRSLFCFIRSFLVANRHADSFLEHLIQRNLAGSLPEKPSVRYVFAGEIPWSSTFPANGFSEFSFMTEEGPDGIKKFGDIKECVRYEALIPVLDFAWESYESAVNAAVSATTLAKEIVSDLNLIGQPQTFDLFTQDQKRATRCVSDHSVDWNNRQWMCFIREETLRVYLERNDYSLIWVLWGERENSVEPNLPSRQSRGQPEQVYNSVNFSCYLRLGDVSETPAWRIHHRHQR